MLFEWIFCYISIFVCLSQYAYNSKSIAGVPMGRALPSLLLRTTRMRSQRLGGASGVAALQTDKQTNKQTNEQTNKQTNK